MFFWVRINRKTDCFKSLAAQISITSLQFIDRKFAKGKLEDNSLIDGNKEFAKSTTHYLFGRISRAEERPPFVIMDSLMMKAVYACINSYVDGWRYTFSFQGYTYSRLKLLVLLYMMENPDGVSVIFLKNARKKFYLSAFAW